jgi:formylmethanofuran dehydrogenase subunit D
MNIKLTNNKNFEINKQFYQTAKKSLKKIKKNLIPLNIFIKKKNNTNIIIADDTNQSQGSYKFRGASSEIINLKKKKLKL